MIFKEESGRWVPTSSGPALEAHAQLNDSHRLIISTTGLACNVCSEIRLTTFTAAVNIKKQSGFFNINLTLEVHFAVVHLL